MPRLLSFVNRETNSEYVVIADEDEVICEDYQRPGYELGAEVAFAGDVHLFPTDRTLWPED